MIGGMIKQSMDEEDLQGRAKVGGVTTGISLITVDTVAGRCGKIILSKPAKVPHDILHKYPLKHFLPPAFSP